MTAGMLDEVEVPKGPKLWHCPCCVLTFNTLDKYADHLIAMRAKIDAALAAAAKAKPR